MSLPSRSGMRGGNRVGSVLLLLLLFVLLSADGVFAGQIIAPTNASTSTTIFELKLYLPSMVYSVIINPLTLEAGQNISPLKGTIILTTDSTATSIDSTYIAYISCSPSPKGGDAEDDNYRTAADRNPVAIVLYSTDSESCALLPVSKGSQQYTMVYSMITANSSLTFEALLKQPLVNKAMISVNPTPVTGQQALPTDSGSGSGGSSSGNGGSGTSLGASPTTTVAMIILYSITGLVTALFLVIIATGAIRAHRHPERYGPRLTGTLGRQRQSRAKGLARAVLESIPIVKFGERDDNKPPEGDVELGPGNRQNQHRSAAAGDAAVGANGEGMRRLEPEDDPQGSGQHQVSSSAQASGEGAAATPVESPAAAGDGSGEEIQPSTAKSPIPKDEGLSCSICTEDFIKGEDIRVLPCNHKYHPDCVDPWLLNVSGTCPLCRIDLTRNTARGDPQARNSLQDNPLAHTAFGDTLNSSSSAQPPPNSLLLLLPPPLPRSPSASRAQNDNDTAATPSRLSRYLDLRRLAHAAPEERLFALRRVNQQEQGQREARRASRLSGMFRGFGIRSGRSGAQEDGGGGGESSTATAPDGEREGEREGERGREQEGGADTLQR